MIVYVDDEIEPFLDAMSEDQRKRFKAVQVDDDKGVALKAAREADSWVFDFFFDETLVYSQDTFEENGLTLFHKWRRLLGEGRPPTAVVSDHLSEAIGPLGPTERYHIHAKRLGVEWIGKKNEEGVVHKLHSISAASVSIAKALRETMRTVYKGEKEDRGAMLPLATLCFDVLRLRRNVKWELSARRHVDQARPPRSVPSLGRFGPARIVLSWLLQHVLPYPSFLISDVHAAVRLHMSLGSFLRLAATSCADVRRLLACEYKGPLADFQQRRWWRAGIDHLVWTLQQSEGGYQRGIHKFAGATELELLSLTEPVVRSTADLVETEEILEAAGCVRVTDDDFPADVDPAWVAKEDVRNNRELRAKVIFADLDAIDSVE